MTPKRTVGGESHECGCLHGNTRQKKHILLSLKQDEAGFTD